MDWKDIVAFLLFLPFFVYMTTGFKFTHYRWLLIVLGLILGVYKGFGNEWAIKLDSFILHPHMEYVGWFLIIGLFITGILVKIESNQKNKK